VSPPSYGDWDFALARYNPDGTLDTSFGTSGTTTTDFGGNPYDQDQANALVVLGDGRLVAAGMTGSPTGATDFALARYNLNGTLDPSFGDGGKVTTDISYFTDGAFALAVQADGRLVAAGFADLDFAVARYLSR